MVLRSSSKLHRTRRTGVACSWSTTRRSGAFGCLGGWAGYPGVESMPTRVVVYAEGAKELHGEFVLPRAPGSILPETEYGAAHVLVQRSCVRHLVQVLQFETPLNLPTPRPPRGSDLHDRKNLRRLLAWPPHRRPDLAVVLVDEDGVADRHRTLKSYLDADLIPPVAIGVAVREFESWLLGAMQAVREVLATSIEEPQDRESMKPGEAKELLERWIEKCDRTAEARLVRVRIAGAVRIDELARSSRSFQRFQQELGATLARVPQ